MPTNKTLFKTNLSKVLKKENYDTRQKKGLCTCDEASIP